ncbi:hypothetical protein D9M70_568690 [compost metagenome]
MQALVLQGEDLAIDPTQHDRHAADLDAFDLVFTQLVAEQRRVPVVDKAPGCVLVGLILALDFGVVGAGIADAALDHAAADDRLLGHAVTPKRLTDNDAALGHA